MGTFKLNPDDKKRINKALKNLRMEAYKFIYRDSSLLNQTAQLYVRQIRTAIRSQRFPLAYKFFDPRYFEWKSRVAPQYASKFWILTGSLINNLKVQRGREKSKIFSGLMVQGRQQRKTKLRISTTKHFTNVRQLRGSILPMTDWTGYAEFVEKRRPLFEPLANNLEKRCRKDFVNWWIRKCKQVWT